MMDIVVVVAATWHQQKLIWAMKKIPVAQGTREDNTTQLYGDSDKPL